MAAPAPHTSPTASFSSAGTRWWIAALFLAIAFVVSDAVQTGRHYAKASASYGVAVRAPAMDAASPTGFADGRRNVVYPARWVDGQHWIMQTQQMLATGDWRVRHVDDDNAPFGRDVHWGSPFRWWLALWACVDRIFTDEPLGAAVERGALYANPALLILLLATLVPWVARRFGDLAATLLAVAVVATPPFYVLFAPDNMDHHGLIEACLMVSFVAVLAGGGGWIREEAAIAAKMWLWLPNQRQARRAFSIAGIAGGFGMWTSGAGMIPVFAATAVGGIVSAWVGRGAPDSVRHDAAVWRRWGASGGAAAFACYLFEYFPHHLGWRLEVNHPLYALAWLGAGEVLAQLTGWLSGHRLPVGRAGRVRLGAGLLALATPALAIASAQARVFVVSDPFLWALSNDYTPEFQSLLPALRKTAFEPTTIVSCLPMLIVPLAAVWLLRRKTPALIRATIALPLCATALFWLMALKELRWWTVSYGVLFGALILLAAIAVNRAATRAKHLVCWLGALALFAPGVALAVRASFQPRALTSDDFYSLAERDLAHALRLRAGAGPLVVLSSPATTSRLLYFASARGLGTAYWENLDGMKRAAAIFAAKSADEAHRLIRAAGITHIVLLSWDDFVAPYVRLARGLSPDDPIADPAFGLELMQGGEPPPWLRRLPDHLPRLPLFQKERVLIYEVTDQTQPEQVLVRATRDALYRGQLAEAQNRIPELERASTNLAVQVALARVAFAARDQTRFAQTLDRIGALLPANSNLEPEDRVDLAAVLMLAGQTDDARAQLTLALQRFDESAVRHLTPGSVATLLGLANRLDVAWPDTRLRDLATELVPPDRRL